MPDKSASRTDSSRGEFVAAVAGIASWKHTTWGSTLKRTVNEGYGLAKVVLLGHPFLYQLAGMQYRAVIASSKCVANFIQGRFGKFARKKHRHLPRKGDAGGAPLACHIGHAHIKMLSHASLNLFDCDRMASFLLQNILEQMFHDLLGQFLAAE